MEWNMLSILCVITAFTIFGLSLGCPEKCKCSTDAEACIIVNCANLSLKNVPNDIPTNVTKLILSNNDISYLSNSLSKFYNLRHLFLDYNQLTSLNLYAFEKQPKLQKLILKSNQIAHIDTENVKIKSNLEILDISENSITDLSNTSFMNMPHLVFLNLSANPIYQIDNETFLPLTQLSTLDLSHVPALNSRVLAFEGLQNLQQVYLRNLSIPSMNYFPLVFQNVTSLHVLDLSGNHIQEITSYTFQPLASLQKLYLDQNYITFIAEDVFEQMPSLKSLSLNSNKLKTITKPIFRWLSGLEYLSISHMPSLYYLGKETFAGLDNLVSLDVSEDPNLSFIHSKLFNNLVNLRDLNLSFNDISTILDQTFQPIRNLSVDLRGNRLLCDCRIDWLIQEIQRSDVDSNLHITDQQNLTCTTANNTQIVLHSHDASDIMCSGVKINDVNTQVSHKLGSQARLFCQGVGSPPPKLTWITPHREVLMYHPVHDLMLWDYPSEEDISENSTYHKNHYWHHSTSYHPDLQSRGDRIFLLNDGSLYIDYVLRTDAGPYTCRVENSRNQTSVVITFTLDYEILMDVKIMSIFVGLGCAASFFMLNLIYAFITAMARRCINQRRREAIIQFMENLDQYRTTKLGTLKDNYNSQVAKIRDTYHSKMSALRENYNTQMNRLKEGASQIKEGTSHRVDIIRDKYHFQQKRLREYTSHQMHQLREAYNNQILKARDYSSMRLGKLHKKYKIKQKHMMKLIDAMNIDNCRTVLEAECVRTESMLLDSAEMMSPTPVESRSVSSEEYATATSSSSPDVSCENIHASVINNMNNSCENVHVSVDIVASEESDKNMSREHDVYTTGAQSNDNGEIVPSIQTGYSIYSGSDRETFVDIQMIDESEDDFVNDNDIYEVCEDTKV